MNFLQSLLGNDDEDEYSLGVSPSQIPMGASPQVEMPQQARPRRSIVDIIGQIGNAISTGGGTPEDALYRTREQREMGDAQRQRAIRMEEQKVQMGEQDLAEGDAELRKGQQKNMAQYVMGLRRTQQKYPNNPEAIFKAGGFLAQQLGLPPENAAQLDQMLRQDPEGTMTMLEGALVEEKPQGSLPSEIQIYEYRNNLPPGERAAFDQQLAQGKGLSQKDLATIAIQQQNADTNAGRLAVMQDNSRLAREVYENPPVKKGKADAPRSTDALDAADATIDQIENALDRLKKSGSISAGGMTGNQRVGAIAYENVPFLERITNQGGFSARQDMDRLLGQSILQLVPLLSDVKIGGKNIDAAKELEFWKNTIASARDYESAQRALTGFRARIKQLRGAQTAPKPERPTGTLSPNKIKPRGAADAKPAPKIGHVQNGWRYNGGNPNQKSSWSKVN